MSQADTCGDAVDDGQRCDIADRGLYLKIHPQY